MGLRTSTLRRESVSNQRVNTSGMKMTLKMWFMIVLFSSVIFIQYYVLSRQFLNDIHNNSTQNEPKLRDCIGFSEDLLQAVVDKLRLDDTVVVSVVQKVLRDTVGEVARELMYTEPCKYKISTLDEMSNSRRLYIITPTYPRPEQLPDLTRMAQTLMHVSNLHWLVIEDATRRTSLVTDLLRRTGIPFEHLLAPMPEIYRNGKDPLPRGVSNRNRGLHWVRQNAASGVFYFADDDNTYDVRLFEEIRSTRRVSMFPVGLCTDTGLSSPVVVNGTFVEFYDGWIGGRKFPVDMAGFAVSVEFLLERPNATMPFKAGYEESGFLQSLAPFEPEEIELKANNCSEILVWHTKTVKNKPAIPINITRYGDTNLVALRELIV